MGERVVLTHDGLQRMLKRLSYEILEKNPEHGELALIGIQRRGVFLARRIREFIREAEGLDVPFGVIDITLYRDDLTLASAAPVVHETNIPFDVSDKTLVLVDDVLFTGRTVRCALSEIMDFGRPRRIELCVLLDRGHRELPIRADFVGKNIPTSREELVDVMLQELDGKDEVVVRKKNVG